MPYDFDKGRYVHQFPRLPSGGADIQLNRAHKINVERNLITFATSRSGKGATQIIPTLLDWPHNALVIDPKGEAAEATAAHRAEEFGHAVHVLDPFETCNISGRYRSRINLLEEIDPTSPHAFRQLNAMADGLVMRHSTEAVHWDGGACEVLAGFLAQVLTTPDIKAKFKGRNFALMRKYLTEPDPEIFGQIVDKLGANPACGRLPITAAGKLTKTGTEAGHFISNAVTNTKWLDDPFMEKLLSSGNFKLSDLKKKPMTIYLVLPMDALGDYGNFLRLFVRMALFHMMQKMPNGSLKGERCLFMLDEFYSLGHISEIQKAAGGMPGFNLHLWPFLQDYNQLIELYGRDGAPTFLGNSDASFFYGVNDPETAEYVSKAAGLVTENDIATEPPIQIEKAVPQRYAGFWSQLFDIETPEYKAFRLARIGPIDYSSSASANHAAAKAEYDRIEQAERAKYQNEMNIYRHAQAVIGKPRLSIEDVQTITARNEGRKIADVALMLRAGACYSVPLQAYFEDKPHA